jgi:hypothetical protein
MQRWDGWLAAGATSSRDPAQPPAISDLLRAAPPAGALAPPLLIEQAEALSSLLR